MLRNPVKKSRGLCEMDNPLSMFISPIQALRRCAGSPAQNDQRPAQKGDPEGLAGLIPLKEAIKVADRGQKQRK